MSAKNDITAFHVGKRAELGKSSKKLIAEGHIPANIYGLSKDSVAVSVNTKAFGKLYAQEGDTGLIYLTVDKEGESIPVLIDDVQLHPVSGEILHATFRRVNLRRKIEAEVPVELVGENEVPETTVLLVRDTITVEALPANLPEKFEVDIEQLTEVGQTITISDLKFDKSKIELVMVGDMSIESPVVILQEVKEEVEPEEETSVDDVEVTTEKSDEGDAESASEKSEKSAKDSSEESKNSE